MFKHAKIAGISGLLAVLLPFAAQARVISGTVSAVNGTQIVLTSENGDNVNVDATGAQVQTKFGSKLPVEGIKSGDTVRVSGKNGQATTDLNATNIRDLSNKQRTVGFNGTIAAVSGSGFTLQVRNRSDQTVSISDNTVIRKGNTTAAASDIIQGMNVTVTGLWDSTANTIAATKIQIIVRNITVSGTVTAVTGNTITLTKPAPAASTDASATATTQVATATTWTVDATNAKFVRRFGASMVITDIQNGDTLSVSGSIIATNITAKVVRDISLQQHNGTFVGTISAINGTSFTLNSKARGDQTINTTASTKITIGGKSAALADLKTGVTATVSGVWDRTNSNVTANRITVRLLSTTFTGVLQDVGDTTITVMDRNNQIYVVDVSKARIRIKGNSKAAVSNLVVQDNVQVRGTKIQGSFNVTASEIRDLTKPAATVNANANANASSNETENENEHPVTPPVPAPAPAANPAPTTVTP